MRLEVERWKRQAQADMDVANANFEIQKYYVSAFFCQQAIEKGLKSLYLSKELGPSPQSHSLSFLAKEVDLPKEFHRFIKELTTKYLDTRYPDAAVDIPVDFYDKEYTKELLEKTKEVFEWLLKNIH